MFNTCHFCGEKAIKTTQSEMGATIPEDGWQGRKMLVGEPSKLALVCRECFHSPDRRKQIAKDKKMATA